MFRTYPRIPFYEQVHDHVPFFTDTGRLNAYCDIPEAIEYGENFIVHREGPEATPYLPNVIVSTNPLVRPEDYGIPLDAMGWDERTVRNVKMSWEEVKRTRNPLWEQGFRFYLLTPKQRHSTHSQWAVTDWHFIWSSDFADPYRTDTRQAGVAEHQMHMNPQAARDLGLNEGDYVYVDANPADRPYRGWKPDDPRYKVARLMLRVKFNPSYPYDVLMIKHAPFIATEKTVRAHETRPDGRAVSEDTGYQASFRYGSHQSLTPRLVDADAPDRPPVPQVEGRDPLRVRLRARQPRGEHRAEGDARAGGVRGGRRARRAGRVAPRHDGSLAGR
ncbi:MAG: hypothetical protein KatS3mg014_0681 [Actinomycetota bacterium]|nr:MAG: hypothetical protein KatS3mg014_0681 [Actinomycetota bacterium]